MMTERESEARAAVLRAALANPFNEAAYVTAVERLEAVHRDEVFYYQRRLDTIAPLLVETARQGRRI